MTRNTIFISHATPNDNEFSIWLASRLEMLGYTIWIDKNHLLGGEKFWQTIQNVIKNNAVKILLICSNNILDTSGNLREGINKEIAFAESISKEYKISDFIIPLHIDRDVPYNAFIGLNLLNHVEFADSWAEGLEQLLKKLKSDAVPLADNAKSLSIFSEWYENEYISDCAIVEKKDIFFSSWLKIKKIPQKLYLYKFHNKPQAFEVYKINSNLTLYQQANQIFTFEDNIKLPSDPLTGKIKYIEKQGFDIETIISDDKKDIVNSLKRLLSNTLIALFESKTLKSYQLANSSYAYYVPRENLKPINFQYPNTNIKKRKMLAGKYLTIGFWHYGVSFRVITTPVLAVSLKAHLVFTDSMNNIIKDKDKQHSLRRRKGSTFYNKQWMDMLLAFIEYLKNGSGEIKATTIDYKNSTIEFENHTEIFESLAGYNDPKTKMKVDMVENYSIEPMEESLDGK